ncbi:MAG: energy-coupled thiamine transporter ThiT [Eubacteriales bacterium]
MSNNKHISTKQLTFTGVAIGLATFISTFIKLPSLPMGGSITLFSMLLICLIGYWYGPFVGLTGAFAYGILQLIIGPYIVHPLQVLLDFPLAFGALGLSGFFWKKKHGLVIGYVVGTLGRLVIHCISGIIFYTTYVSDSSENMLAIWAGIAYNMTYIIPEMILTLILISIPAVSSMLHRVKEIAIHTQ